MAVHSTQLATPAAELAARLEDYELALQAISRSGFEAARYRLLIDELTAIGHCTIALPQFAADFLEVTIQHFELVRILCRPRPAAQGIGAEVAVALLTQQCDAVRALRDKCLGLIAVDRARKPRIRRPAGPMHVTPR
ncbi:MAG TPA: hypothetical protein VKD22_10375 [Ramlibacter sp.]|nr:hypothetical protein [Ramlibacter sp.]